jgi:pentose-5-phosphate-3-epimerase
VRAIKERWPDTVVGIDIGVSVDTIPALAEAGVSRFAAGSAVFGGVDPKTSVDKLEGLVTDTLKK